MLFEKARWPEMHHVSVHIETQSIEDGRSLLSEEMAKRFPGSTITITHDGVVLHNGQDEYSADVDIGDGADNTSDDSGHDSAPEVSHPHSIMVLFGNDTTWGIPSPPFQDKKPPFRIATVGDTEDHRLMDKRWRAALTGSAPLWDGYLSIKYRTNTVVMVNGPHFTVEQGDLAVECDGEPTQNAIMECLASPE